MSVSCLRNSRPGDILVWNQNSRLTVVDVNNGWPVVYASDTLGRLTSTRVTITDIYIGGIVKIIKKK